MESLPPSYNISKAHVAGILGEFFPLKNDEIRCLLNGMCLQMLRERVYDHSKATKQR